MENTEQILQDILRRLEMIDERTFEIMRYINGECVKKREVRYIFIVLNIIIVLLAYLVFRGIT